MRTSFEFSINFRLRKLFASALLFFFAMQSVDLARADSADGAAPATRVERPQKITIGFIPAENPQAQREHAAAFAKLLQSRIDVPIDTYVSNDYNGLIEAMREGKIDFAFFSALTFVVAEKRAGAKVLLKKVWTGPFYYSTVLVSTKSGIKDIKSLKGKRIAFVDEKSASGYLYPQVFFKKQKIDAKSFFSEIIFSGNHQRSVELLNEGKVDAIAVYANDKAGRDGAWNRFAGKKSKTKVKSIWMSEPIPNDPFCVRQTFYDAYPKYAHDLMFTLIELSEDTQQRAQFEKLLDVSGFALATSQQYEPVREMVRALDLMPK